MTSIYRAHELAMEKGLLFKPHGEDDWNTAALFAVQNRDRFSVTIERSSSPVVSFVAGIAPKDANLSHADIERRTGAFGWFSFEADNTVSWKVLHPLRLGLPNTPSSGELSRTKGGPVTIEYEGGNLYVAVGISHVQIVKQIPAGDYRPCIALMEPGDTLRVTVDSRKRPWESDHDVATAATKVSNTLWTERLFTDATVVCGDRRIPVHRCVLAAASPFFARAFQGEMREATEGRIDIKDADADAVEAVLHFLYVGSLTSTADPSKVLPLAHRYELSRLVKVCVSQMLSLLSNGNVVKFVAALRPFKLDESIQGCWAELQRRIESDPRLIEGLMDG